MTRLVSLRQSIAPRSNGCLADQTTRACSVGQPSRPRLYAPASWPSTATLHDGAAGVATAASPAIETFRSRYWLEIHPTSPFAACTCSQSPASLRLIGRTWSPRNSLRMTSKSLPVPLRRLTSSALTAACGSGRGVAVGIGVAVGGGGGVSVGAERVVFVGGGGVSVGLGFGVAVGSAGGGTVSPLLANCNSSRG